MKEKMYFPNMDSLQPVVNIINEAAITLGDPTRTIKDSPLVEVFAAALGGGSGAGVSFLALYGLGTVGLSAAGITSALATAGAIVGGGMAAGVLVLAAPVVGLAGAGVAVSKQIKKKKLRQEKKRLYEEAKKKYPLIVAEFNRCNSDETVSQERKDILKGLDITLKKAIEELEADLLM
ncbi:hypothetical protein [Sellimonas intestinalis]|uniref:hypothetical protein n=1 Tax=Sellimonas intestinalis TaxID=1653434 RepID=UPI003AB18662